VLRFWNHEVLKSPEGVLEVIAARVKKVKERAE